MVQLLFAASVLPQVVLATENTPVVAMLLMLSVPVPLLVRVAFFVELLPFATLPKISPLFLGVS